VQHVLRAAFRKVVQGEVAEVVGGLQDGHVGVVDGEEGGEGVEGVADGAGFVEGGGGDGERVARGEFADEVGLEGAFEVHVEFAFGEGGDEGGEVCGRGGHCDGGGGWKRGGRVSVCRMTVSLSLTPVFF